MVSQSHANSRSYNTFKSCMEKMKENYTKLNPIDGLLCGPDGVLSSEGDVAIQFIRGGFIQAWIAWEAFARDILEEAFEVAIQITENEIGWDFFFSKATTPLGYIAEKWPQAQIIVKKAIERRMATGKKKKPSEVAFELLTTEDIWKILLNEFLENTMKNFSPVFGGEDGIDNN